MTETEQKIRVMLVDDDDFLVDMYSAKFSSSGVEVVPINSGPSLIERLKKGETADLFATPSEQDAPAGSKQTLKPLRIVHSRGGKDGGRLVISGRMADVCAELDRMAAREAALAYG